MTTIDISSAAAERVGEGVPTGSPHSVAEARRLPEAIRLAPGRVGSGRPAGQIGPARAPGTPSVHQAEWDQADWAMAKVALARKDSGDPFYTAKLATARFYFAKVLPETAGLIRSARAGLAPLMAMDEAMF